MAGILVPSAAPGGLIQLATGSLSGVSTTINSISGSYKNLYLIIKDLTFSASTSLSFRFNSDSTSIYSYFYAPVGGTTWTRTLNESGASYLVPENPDGDSIGVLNIYDYANTTTFKIGNYFGARGDAEPAFPGSFTYQSLSAISSITVYSRNGTATMTAGTYILYGVN